MSISLEDVEQEPGGTLQTITIDGKGRVVESSPADTDDLPEGSTNLYFTDARAQAAVHLVFNRIDAAGDIRVDADGNLRVTN
jgi:hypothetical protein